MNLVASAMLLFSVLVPTKLWYSPSQPLNVAVKVPAGTTVQLVMRSFVGKDIPSSADAEISEEKTLDIKALFPQIEQPGTYILFAVPKGRPTSEFVGTPLVIQARTAPRFGGNVSTNVLKVSPLVYASAETPKGTIKMVFWYDVAPNTVASFINLAAGGYFDGTSFHRIVPGFVIQGGDPTGTGFGGPGYNLDAEFSDRAHEDGVLSMARTGDPLEGKGIPPRPDFANSAGSQFFICLAREKTQALDRKYTAFGKVADGWPVVQAIAGTELADATAGKPKEPQVITKMTIVPVTSKDDPYKEMIKLEMGDQTAAATRPATQPVQP